MTKTNERHADESHESKEQFSSDFDTLKTSFVQLRDDVHKLLSDALGAGKTGAGAIKDRAADAVDGLKDRVHDGKDRVQDSVEKFGKRIEQRPLISVAIALGIGFILARLLHPKR